MKNLYKAEGETYGYFTSIVIKTVVILFFALFLSKISTAQTVMAKLSIQLLLNTNAGSANTADGCTVLYANGFSSGIGPEDSYKFNNLDENMALPCGNKLLSVEGKPTVQTYDTVQLKIWQYRQNNYYLKFDGSNFSPTLAAVLKDNYLQQDQNISLSGVTIINYTLTTDTASKSANRFCVVLKPAGALPINMLSFSALQRERGIAVDWKVAGETNMAYYEIEKSTNGLTFAKKSTHKVTNPTANSNSYQWIDNEPNVGSNYYRVKMVENSGKIELSKIVKVFVDSRHQNISIFPNPVKGNTIGLQLMNVGKGTYQIKIYNSNGQQQYATTMTHSGGNATQTIRLLSNLKKGTYTFIMTNGDSKYSKSILLD